MDEQDRASPVIDVSVQLDSSLGRILDAADPLYDEVLQDVERRIDGLIHLLGIPGRVVLGIGPLLDSTGGEWMRLRVNGTLCRYPQEVLVLAWSSATGQLAGEKPADIASRLREAAEDGAGRVAEFLGLACTEIISWQPAVLLGPAHVVAYSAQLEGSVHDQPPDPWPPDTSRLMRVLKRVLELRISISDTETISRVLADNARAPYEDVVEEIVDALTPEVVELRVPEAYLARLRTPDENGSDPLTFSREGLFLELGVLFPPFSAVPGVDLKPNSFTFVINHLPTLPIVGLEADECLVNETPERLQQMEIEGREAINPATQQPGAIVDVADSELLEAAGLTTWDQVSYCVLCFAEALRRNCFSFVHRRAVEVQLEQLGQAFPALVEVARAKMPKEQITRVLRALGSEQISIRNLRLILERLLDYQYRTSDFARYSIIDDRLSVSDYIQDQHSDALVAFVRAGLKRQISDKYARGTSTLVVYLLDQELESMFNGTDTDEERQEYILTALADELTYLPPTAQTPSILTAIGVRAGLREAIKLTFPRIGVLAYQELQPSLNVQPVARISLR